MVDLLQERLGSRAEDAYDVAAGMSEIRQNTFDHNGRECGFLSIRVYSEGRLQPLLLRDPQPVAGSNPAQRAFIVGG